MTVEPFILNLQKIDAKIAKIPLMSGFNKFNASTDKVYTSFPAEVTGFTEVKDPYQPTAIVVQEAYFTKGSNFLRQKFNVTYLHERCNAFESLTGSSVGPASTLATSTILISTPPPMPYCPYTITQGDTCTFLNRHKFN